MVQPITPALTALLKSKLQAGPSGFRGEIEIDHVVPSTDPVVSPGIVQSVFGYSDANPVLPANVTPGNVLIVVEDVWKASSSGSPIAPNTGSLANALGGGNAWTQLGTTVRTAASGERSEMAIYAKVATGTEPACIVNLLRCHLGIYELEGCTIAGATVVSQDVPGAAADLDIGSLGTPAAGQLAFLVVAQYTPDVGFITFASGWTVDSYEDHVIFDGSRPFFMGHIVSAGSPLEAEVLSGVSYPWAGIAVLLAASDTGTPAFVSTTAIQVATIGTDYSRKMAAAQLDVTLDNERGDRGYYTATDPIFIPNSPVRAYAWYGARANRVRVFTGILDRIHEARDPRQIALKARSRMKWLLEQGFKATGPQGAEEEGAIRTEANGVYLDKSPEYIVADIADRGGWPAADRDFAVSGVVIAEYLLTDETSWAEQIAGIDRLTTATGFDFWDDELGILHFKPNALAETSEPDPDYTFEAGVDVLKLDHETDDEERATRVEVSGPMTSDIPAWKEEWATTALKHPVGTMYRPSEPAYLYVIDRVTGYLYKLRQSDRKVVAKWYLGASLANQPIGLSGDPTDPSIFLVLDAHLPGSGTYTNCKVRKFSVATKALISTTNLPDGQWSDMKFDGSHLWLTNFGDDKLYEKTFVAGGTAGATASFSYAGLTNPTGMYLNGTTIGLFFNGGASFHLVSTAAPGTITGTQSTKGTHILGGEADTTTDADLYATNEAGDFGATAGHVWKFQLTEEVTTTVVKTASDQALEDALGFQSGIGDRVHDLHTGAAAHPFETRLATYAMKVVYSPAQAQAVADAQLELLQRLRRVLDLATLGNPAIQINDVIWYVDPIAGIDAMWLLDSYRAELGADADYTSSMSLLPWEAVA